MINIFKIEVSTNGRSHIFHTEDVNVQVKNLKEIETFRAQMLEKFKDQTGENGYVYLHHKEKI